MGSFALFDSINSFPKASDTDATTQIIRHLLQQHKDNPAICEAIQSILENETGSKLLNSLISHSPHITRIIEQDTMFFIALCKSGIVKIYNGLCDEISSYDPLSKPQDEIMRELRIYKRKLSLITSVADICSIWTLEEVTGALSTFANTALNFCCRFLLHQAHKNKEIICRNPEYPDQDSGVVILSLGKLGGNELNYSSDIDIMFLYQPDKVDYSGRHNVQHFFSRMAQSLVTMMQERTKEGYVFRTDLRLRPDPSSTPLAVTIPAALTYYESVGQNWERAALIKARVAAGDQGEGIKFIENISPFIWRKHLDFAAIADIQSIKRQMTPQHNRPITLPGHNIKTGRGGIREIEFFAQINQLIWGGRIAALRVRATCHTLQILTDNEIINNTQQEELTQSYQFLRKVEHRLQMMQDQQTHSIPESTEEREKLAAFLGYATCAEFEKELRQHLERTHKTYIESFSESTALGDSGKLSFTGVDIDPDTIETLRNMGFLQPETIASLIQAWHHGKRRATRSKRARELITELTPELLRHFSNTSNPDQAFIKLDEFMSNLPSGVQIFSLFMSHPKLLELMSVIMGSSPALANRLARAPDLLDIVLTADFYSAIEEVNNLPSLLQSAKSPEDNLSLLNRYRNEQSFLIGVQLIRQQISLQEASCALSKLADNILTEVQHTIEVEFVKTYGVIEGGSLSIIAMGRLGVQELTFGSDLDLMFVYSADPQAHSDGKRSFSASVYYNRLCQRIVGALTALGKGGRLYEVDTRLRPSGSDGLLAVNIEGFDGYFENLAWTFELMALTKARIITGKETLCERLQHCINKHLLKSRNQSDVAHDIHTMRDRVAESFSTDNPWNIKYARGGLMDLEFIAQYFVLIHGSGNPELLHKTSKEVFSLLENASIISEAQSTELTNAASFLNTSLSVLRLCGYQELDSQTTPEGTKSLMAHLLREENFATLEKCLLETEKIVRKHYSNIIATVPT